jgi:hypothetical protein
MAHIAAGLLPLVLGAGAAVAATITAPTGNPFVVPGDASGNPQPFTVSASGFTHDQLVYVEQCDGIPPTAQGWSPTANCDLGSSPAAAIASASGDVTFAAADPNHGFHPFKGASPQGLFNCLSPHDPSPNNGLPDFRNCKIRVSTDNAAITADQAFLTIQLPDAVAGTTTTTTTTTSSSSSTSTTSRSTSTSTTTRPASTSTTTRPASTSTTATSSTTTPTHGTTTSSTVPSGCDTEPVAPTFASIDCRLVALLARVTAESDLGSFGPKLVQNLSKAKDSEEAGGSACAASDLKRTHQQLKQAIRDMIQYAHHLKTHAARKKLTDALRSDLLAEGDPLTTDVKRLKSTVQCPADAPR